MSLPTDAIIGIAIASGVVLLGGGGAYYFTRKGGKEDEFADPVGKPRDNPVSFNNGVTDNRNGAFLGGKSSRNKRGKKQRRNSKNKK
jgi:hypothetical protein